MNNIYYKIYKWDNLILAWKKARRGKTKKEYIIKFEEDIVNNLQELQFELMTQTYSPRPLINFILRDPKTRKISKSDFRDRIIHHALMNVIQNIFEKSFIYDSCANQKNKGTFFAIQRFEKFKRKVTNNLHSQAFCLKADIKHYFEEVDHKILCKIIKRKISCKKTLNLIKVILKNGAFCTKNKGMPLGNLTSQFFANVYLNNLDYFVKNKIKAKYYIRYVDDFVILHKDIRKLEEWKQEIEIFLMDKLNLELHPQKSRIISLSMGIDFVGFRNFYHHKLLRKRNIRNMFSKVENYNQNLILERKLLEIFQGWNAYATMANTHKLKRIVLSKINNTDSYLFYKSNYLV